MSIRALAATLTAVMLSATAAPRATAAPAVAPSPAQSGPRDFTADIATAKDLQRRGRSQDAIALLRADLKLDPANRDLTVALAQTYSYAGDQGDAISLLDAFLVANPADVDARILLAQAYSFNHDYDAAEQQYGTALHDAPDDEDAQVGLGETFTFEGKYADAKSIFEKILASDPKNSDARVGLAGAEAFSGDYPHARSDYQTVLNADPDNVDALVGLASVEYWLGNVPAATSLNDRALALDPGDSDAQDLLKQLRVKVAPQLVATNTSSHSNDGVTHDEQLEERFYTQPTTSIGLVEELYQLSDGGESVLARRLGLVGTYVGADQFGVDLRVVDSRFLSSLSSDVPSATDDTLTFFDTTGPWNWSIGQSEGGVDGSIEANGGRSSLTSQSPLVRIATIFADAGFTKRGSSLQLTTQTAGYNDGNRFHEFTADVSHVFGIGAYNSITPDIGVRDAGYSNSYDNPYVATNPGYYNYSAQRGITVSLTAQRSFTERLSAGVVGTLGEESTIVPTYGACYPLYCAAGSFDTGMLPSEHFEPYVDYEGDRFSVVGAYYEDHVTGSASGVGTVQPFAANTLDLTFSIRLP